MPACSLGELALSLGKLHISRCALERGLALRPAHGPCLEMLAEVCYSIGDMDACIAAADRLMALSRPPNPRGMLLKGMAMKHQPNTAFEGGELVEDAREEGGACGGVVERVENARAAKRCRLCEADKGVEEVDVERATWERLMDAAMRAFETAGEAAAMRPERGLNIPVMVRVLEMEAGETDVEMGEPEDEVEKQVMSTFLRPARSFARKHCF